MGQYHYIANLDKREFLHPHELGDGLKLMEFGASGEGTMFGLSLLLACSNGRGGGDFDAEIADDPRDYKLVEAIVGRWAGDRIAIIGDYAEDGDFPGFVASSPAENPWTDDFEKESNQLWVDISVSVRRVIECNAYFGPRVRASWGGVPGKSPYETPGVLKDE